MFATGLDEVTGYNAAVTLILLHLLKGTANVCDVANNMILYIFTVLCFQPYHVL